MRANAISSADISKMGEEVIKAMEAANLDPDPVTIFALIAVAAEQAVNNAIPGTALKMIIDTIYSLAGYPNDLPGADQSRVFQLGGTSTKTH